MLVVYVYIDFTDLRGSVPYPLTPDTALSELGILSKNYMN